VCSAALVVVFRGNCTPVEGSDTSANGSATTDGNTRPNRGGGTRVSYVNTTARDKPSADPSSFVSAIDR